MSPSWITPTWEERVILPAGHHTHAVGYLVGVADRVTACGKNAETGDFQDDDTAVTCPACQRATET